MKNDNKEILSIDVFCPSANAFANAVFNFTIKYNG